MLKTENPALFFINTNQHIDIQSRSSDDAFLIHYNRYFYCIHINHEEVACDGLLFNNIFEIPKVDLLEDELKNNVAIIQSNQ